MGALETLADKYGFTDEEADQLRDELSPAQLRQHVKKLEKEAQKVPSLEAKVASFENKPLVESAFKQAGLDWQKVDEMPPFVRQQIEAFGDYGDKDKVAEFIQANRLPVAQQQQPGQQQQQGLPEHPSAGQVIPAEGSPAQQIQQQAMNQSQQAPGQFSPSQVITDAMSEEEVMKVVREAGLPVAGED